MQTLLEARVDPNSEHVVWLGILGDCLRINLPPQSTQQFVGDRQSCRLD